MKEIIVRCPDCGDMWHTQNEVGGGEVCTDCADIFTIEESDIVTRKQYEEEL